VFVPGPVNGPGLGATIRMMPGPIACGRPGVKSVLNGWAPATKADYSG
jgi:hypothetical protein